ncbi:MAG: hypothetical protein M1839_003045 [Geoglossum umbratile]|nr:MAG: hypothetical protein M1839_003045 [Geoglossum umbratile]
MATELVIDTTTVVSLGATLVTLLAAYGASLRFLPRATGAKLRVLFVWHLFDALIHFIFEGSYLYNCFFTYADGQPNPSNFLNHPARAYGAAYGSSPTAKMWQEYGKADRRWMFADLTTISLELLTVFAAGFMTFAPEWLSGSQNLDTSNFMYLWVYLFFFNTLWVWIPLWVLHEAHDSIALAFKTSSLNASRGGAKKGL